MGKLYRIDSRGRVTIPPEILEKIKAEQGDYVIFEKTNGDVKIKKVNIES